MSCRIRAGMSKGRTRGPGDARGLPRPGPHSRLHSLHYCLPRGVPSRLQGHCQQTARLDLSLWPLASLAESHKSECAGGEARGRRGLAVMATYKRRKFSNQGKRAGPAPEIKHTDPAPIRARAPGRRSAAKLLNKDEARRIVVNIAKLPDLIRT
jgi:hypothetical protein